MSFNVSAERFKRVLNSGFGLSEEEIKKMVSHLEEELKEETANDETKEEAEEESTEEEL